MILQILILKPTGNADLNDNPISPELMNDINDIFDNEDIPNYNYENDILFDSFDIKDDEHYVDKIDQDFKDDDHDVDEIDQDIKESLLPTEDLSNDMKENSAKFSELDNIMNHMKQNTFELSDIIYNKGESNATNVNPESDQEFSEFRSESFDNLINNQEGYNITEIETANQNEDNPLS